MKLVLAAMAVATLGGAEARLGQTGILSGVSTPKWLDTGIAKTKALLPGVATPKSVAQTPLLGGGMLTPLWLDDTQTDVDDKRCKIAFKKLAEGCHHLAEEIFKALKAGKITKEEAHEKVEKLHAGCKKKAEALAKKCKHGDNDMSWIEDLALPDDEPEAPHLGGVMTPLWLDDSVTQASDDRCKMAFEKLEKGCHGLAEEIAKAVKEGKITKDEAEKKMEELHKGCKAKAEALEKKCHKTDMIENIPLVVGGIENEPLTVPIPEN